MPEPTIADQVVDPLILFLKKSFLICPDERFLFSEDEKESRIAINAIEAFNLDIVEKKPGIAIERGDFSWRNLSLDRLGEVGKDSTTFLDLIDGTLVCHCYAQNPKVSADLAALVFFIVRASRKELREMGYHEADSQAITKTSRFRGKDSSKAEFRSTTVTVHAVISLKIESTKP